MADNIIEYIAFLRRDPSPVSPNTDEELASALCEIDSRAAIVSMFTSMSQSDQRGVALWQSGRFVDALKKLSKERRLKNEDFYDFLVRRFPPDLKKWPEARWSFDRIADRMLRLGFPRSPLG